MLPIIVQKHVEQKVKPKVVINTTTTSTTSSSTTTSTCIDSFCVSDLNSSSISSISILDTVQPVSVFISSSPIVPIVSSSITSQQSPSSTSSPSAAVPTAAAAASAAAPAVASNPDAASVHLYTNKWLQVIQSMRSSSACTLSVHELDELENHITHGITLPLDVEPINIHYNNTTTVTDNHLLVADRISEYMSIGAVQQLPADAPTPLLVQPLHVILKDGKKPRLVIDLSRNLNQLLPHTTFKYSSVHDAVLLSTHRCFYSKLDISNCFLSFPLHPSCYKYFTFQFDGRYYQFTRLPFGLSTAPRYVHCYYQ
jgi:hypothetical protein